MSAGHVPHQLLLKLGNCRSSFFVDITLQNPLKGAEWQSHRGWHRNGSWQLAPERCQVPRLAADQPWSKVRFLEGPGRGFLGFGDLQRG